MRTRNNKELVQQLSEREKAHPAQMPAKADTWHKVIFTSAALTGLLVGLYILSRFNYPLFHSIADMATVFMAIGIFVLVWSRRRLLDSHFYLFVGIAFLFFALWDLLHLLGNKGMGIFPQFDNLGPTLYMISRYILGFSMLIAPLFIKRRLKPVILFTGYFVVSLVLLLTVFYWKNFPPTYIEGVGLTSFKIISDYLVCGILLGSAVLLLIHRQALDARVFRLIMFSLTLSIATGLAFTAYTDPFGVTNAVGHFLQIASLYLVYSAFVETIIAKPQDILYRNLAQSEEKYHTLFSNMTEEVHFWRLERANDGQIMTWRLVDANPPTLKTWGRQTVEEIRGKTTDEIFGPGSAEHYMPVVRKVMAEGVPYSYEDYFPNLKKYFQFTTVPLGEYFITTGADITAIKQADEFLRHHAMELESAKTALEKEVEERRRVQADLENISAQHQLALETARMGWWHFDPVRNYVWWDERYKEIFGFDEYEKPFDDMLTSRLLPEDLPGVLAKVHSALDPVDPKPYSDEFRIVLSDGSIKWIEAYGITTFEDSGSNRHAVSFDGTVGDITRRKKAEEGLKRSNTELEAANTELEAFSYSVSHDLRAPLRSMAGFSSVLLEDYADILDDDGKRYLGYIQDASDLMGRLIDDLLKLSKVNRSEMNYETINLTDTASIIVDEFNQGEPNQKTSITIAPDIQAFGDRNLLRIALANLLGNAWKFTRNTALPQIEMGMISQNEKCAYFIRDNGAGFNMAYADKIFQPFQRLHKSTEYPGTGIGLSIVQRIIHRHGGEIWAESKEGEGATFYFTLG